MSEILINLIVFFLKTIVIVAAIILIIASTKKKSGNQLIITHLNKKWLDVNKYFTKMTKQKISHKKSQKKKKKCFYVLFKGDMNASSVVKLRNEISAIINNATKNDKVCINIESPGGTIIDYGLANAQLQRLKQAKISLDVVVDRVAASGGYLMACVADKIIAAPYSFIGSIGVAFELFNAHELLKHHHIQTETITSKKYKRTLTPFSKTTPEAKAKVREDLSKYQQQFESSILKYRPKLNINEVATGEYWCAENAIKLGLVDELGTSDEYLFNTMKEYDVYQVEYQVKASMKQKFFNRMKSYVQF